MNEEEK